MLRGIQRPSSSPPFTDIPEEDEYDLQSDNHNDTLNIENFMPSNYSPRPQSLYLEGTCSYELDYPERPETPHPLGLYVESSNNCNINNQNPLVSPPLSPRSQLSIRQYSRYFDDSLDQRSLKKFTTNPRSPKHPTRNTKSPLLLHRPEPIRVYTPQEHSTNHLSVSTIDTDHYHPPLQQLSTAAMLFSAPQTQPNHYYNYHSFPQESTRSRYHLPPPSKSYLKSLHSYRLSDFEIFNTLGTGTFGRVYLCKLKQFVHNNYILNRHNQYFALKVMNKLEVIRLKQVDHIHSEKAILSNVEFPFIVKLHGTFQDHQNIYMLLEYAIGGELFSCLRKMGRFTLETSRFYAAEIVLTLEYLHNKNIIYRDLKPENLLLDEKGHIKITDFGFSKYVTNSTFTLCGTPEYLAPEIIGGHGHGREVDWWALGILIYEMLVGCPPFYDNSQFGIYEKILVGNIQFPDHVDATSQDLILKLLNRDRSERLGDAKSPDSYYSSVRYHPWFKGMDWDAILHRTIKAPFYVLHKHPGDTNSFEPYPELPMDQVFSGSNSLTSQQQMLFSYF